MAFLLGTIGGGQAQNQAQTRPEIISPPMDGATLRTRLAPMMAAPGKPMPKDQADMDAWLARKDWMPLVKRLHAPTLATEIYLDMNWEQTKLFNGAGFGVSYNYMADLWRLGSALPPVQGEEMKRMAGIIYLYNQLLARIDGLACADPSAPAHRADQLVSQNRDLIVYLGGLSKADRAQLGSLALDLEAATASVRTHDDVLCRGGAEEIARGLQAQGEKPLTQVPSPPGTIGKSYVVAPAPDYQPGFIDDTAATSKMVEARKAATTFMNRYLMLTDAAKQPPATTANHR